MTSYTRSVPKNTRNPSLAIVANMTTSMPTRNVNLTDELDQFILDKVKNGRYENASEVVRAAIAEGEASGIAEGDVFARIRAQIKSRAASK